MEVDDETILQIIGVKRRVSREEIRGRDYPSGDLHNDFRNYSKEETAMRLQSVKESARIERNECRSFSYSQGLNLFPAR